MEKPMTILRVCAATEIQLRRFLASLPPVVDTVAMILTSRYAVMEKSSIRLPTAGWFVVATRVFTMPILRYVVLVRLLIRRLPPSNAVAKGFTILLINSAAVARFKIKAPFPQLAVV